MASRSLSSRDIRFSAAVYVPCDKGDGFRSVAVGAGLEDVVAGEEGAGRAEALEEDEPVRWCMRGEEPFVGGGEVEPDAVDLLLPCFECACPDGTGAGPRSEVEPWLLLARCR